MKAREIEAKEYDGETFPNVHKVRCEEIVKHEYYEDDLMSISGDEYNCNLEIPQKLIMGEDIIQTVVIKGLKGVDISIFGRGDMTAKYISCYFNAEGKNIIYLNNTYGNPFTCKIERRELHCEEE